MIDTPTQEMWVKLRMGCKAWQNCTFKNGNNSYLLKIREHEDNYEIISLNKKRVLEVIQENLSLFQYVLGPKVTPESVFSTLANSEDSFYDILQHDNALVGILLGFGTTNSILGSRCEALGTSVRATPTLPYASMQELKTQTEAWDYLILGMMFKGNFPDISSAEKKPSMGMDNIEEELAYIDNLEDESSPKLWKYSPRLIFRKYKTDPTNDDIIARYESEQKQLNKLLKSEDFFSQVLSRLGATISDESTQEKTPDLTASDLANALFEDLESRKYASLDGAKEGLEDAYWNKEARYEEPDFDQYYTLWALDQIQAKDVPGSIHIKELKKGFGEKLNDQISKGTFHYSVELASDEDHFPIKAERNVELDINALIPGFAKGIQGMQIGEIREIYIPPQEAYGLFTDFLSWQPLRISVELLAIQSDSPPLKIHQSPLAPERSLSLSSEEKKELMELKKKLSYFDAKALYTFHKDALKAPILDHIQALKNASESKKKHYNIDALDRAALMAYQERDLNERKATEKVFSSLKSENALIPNRLYIEYSERGTITKAKTVTLHFTDLLKNKLLEKTIDHADCSYLMSGLEIGLKDLKAGDKGKLYIHPELCDRSLFRNPLAGKALIVNFEAN